MPELMLGVRLTESTWTLSLIFLAATSDGVERVPGIGRRHVTRLRSTAER
jgi:hypothetical protein